MAPWLALHCSLIPADCFSIWATDAKGAAHLLRLPLNIGVGKAIRQPRIFEIDTRYSIRDGIDIRHATCDGKRRHARTRARTDWKVTLVHATNRNLIILNVDMSRSVILVPLVLAAGFLIAIGVRQGEQLTGTYVALGIGIMFKGDKFQLLTYGSAARGTYRLAEDSITLDVKEWIAVRNATPETKEMLGKVSKDRMKIEFEMGDPLVRQSESVENWVPDAAWTTRMKAQFADAPESYFTPQFDHDGSRILYSVKTKFHDFYSSLVDVKSGHSSDLKGKAREANTAVVIPNSQRILANLHGDIVTMNMDGTGVQVLVKRDDRGEDYSYSYDGKRITFSWSGGGDPMANDYIYTMDAGGGDVRRLTDVGVGDSEPSFSPDGKSIVFVSRRAGRWNLFIMNSDGSNVRALTTDDTQVQGPRFSPDGKYIVYCAFPNDGWDVFVMRSDGTQPKRLTKTPGTDNQEHSPTYSPDGKTIAFAGSRNGVDGIFIMNADGTGERRLVPAP